MNGLPFQIFRSDVVGVAPVGAHQDHDVSRLVERERAVLPLTRIALPAVRIGPAEFAHNVEVVVRIGEAEIGLHYGFVFDRASRFLKA